MSFDANFHAVTKTIHARKIIQNPIFFFNAIALQERSMTEEEPAWMSKAGQ